MENMKKKSSNFSIALTVLCVILALYAVVFFLPILWALLTTFKEVKYYNLATVRKNVDWMLGLNHLTTDNFKLAFENFEIPELIAFSNTAVNKVGKILVALSGDEGNYKYVISSQSVDLKALAKEINTALSGRGGGRPEMIQGSFSSTMEQIKEYFK